MYGFKTSGFFWQVRSRDSRPCVHGRDVEAGLLCPAGRILCHTQAREGKMLGENQSRVQSYLVPCRVGHLDSAFLVAGSLRHSDSVRP